MTQDPSLTNTSVRSLDLGLIGNCAYQALITPAANVAWLCWPRFDSSFVFGGLIGGEAGGEFSIRPDDAEFSTEQSYRRNTNILETEFCWGEHAFRVTDFAPRFHQFGRYFKPTMLVRRLQALRGHPRIRVRCTPRYDYGAFEPECFLASNHVRWQMPGAQLRLTSNAPISFLRDGTPFALDQDVFLVLTWGQPLEAPLEETCRVFEDRTDAYWRTWVRHGNIPLGYQKEVIRSALTLKLHQFEDTGAITAATTTSLPEHDQAGRNWDYRFCWIRDAYFTLAALRRLGQFEEMEKFVSYLVDIVEGGAAEIQPVYGIGRETRIDERVVEGLPGFLDNLPVRVGNDAYKQRQHDAYGEMILSMAPLFVDQRFAGITGRRSTAVLYELLERIEATMQDPDAGLWEKRDVPRVHTFSLLMHWAGAQAAARIGTARGDAKLRATGERLAREAHRIIEQKCWREDRGFYADAIDSEAADAALLMMVNLGYFEPGSARAHRHVQALAQKLRTPDAPHLLRRYVHHDGIGPTESTFTVCGFWFAEALARVGERDAACEVFEGLLTHKNHLGLLSEDIAPSTGAQWGNFPQTYSHVGLIHCAFALCPDLGLPF